MKILVWRTQVLFIELKVLSSECKIQDKSESMDSDLSVLSAQMPVHSVDFSRVNQFLPLGKF